MNGNQVNRKLAAAFIHADQLGLDFMRMFDKFVRFRHRLFGRSKIAFTRQLQSG